MLYFLPALPTSHQPTDRYPRYSPIPIRGKGWKGVHVLLPIALGLAEDVLERGVDLFGQVAGLEGAAVLLEGQAGACLHDVAEGKRSISDPIYNFRQKRRSRGKGAGGGEEDEEEARDMLTLVIAAPPKAASPSVSSCRSAPPWSQRPSA